MKQYPIPATDKTVTPEDIFFQRRRFLKQAGLGLTAGATLLCRPGGDGLAAASGEGERGPLDVPFERPGTFPAKRNEAIALPANAAGPLTPREVAATHNNYYEFLPGRGGPVWKYTADFVASPWTIEISGECNKPRTLDLDDLFKFEHEERLYHFRCVERWAMNIPWSGFPLSKLIKSADPTSKARFVRFTSVKRPDQMPGMRKAAYYDWPYVEALRLDEAMNELAMCVTGVYGKPLPIQHGAPMRIAVPWKYGYKNPKSIVKIEFLKEQPRTFWMIQPHEYGFLSNVNPYIPHPRWSQAKSFWLQDEEWFPTAIFNGYESYVGHLYPDEPRELQRPLHQGQIAR